MTRYTAFPRLAAFNRECEFTAKKQLLIRGKIFQFGDVIDKTLLTTRRLRQLFEQRQIVQGDFEEKVLIPPHSIDFKQLPTNSIISWLAERKKMPRPGSDRAKIIALAETVQRKEKEAADALVSGNADKEPDLQGVQRKTSKRRLAESNV